MFTDNPDYHITRKQYHAREFTHEQYFKQVVDAATLHHVRKTIGLDRVVASFDPYFNDIPLKEWEQAAAYMPLTALNQLAQINGENIIWNTDRVCALKAAAKQLRRENSVPRRWNLQVRFYRAPYQLNTEITGTVDGIMDYYLADDGRLNVGDGPNDRILKVVGFTFKPVEGV